jgi:hypothetical protein
MRSVEHGLARVLEPRRFLPGKRQRQTQKSHHQSIHSKTGHLAAKRTGNTVPWLRSGSDSFPLEKLLVSLALCMLGRLLVTLPPSRRFPTSDYLVLQKRRPLSFSEAHFDTRIYFSPAINLIEPIKGDEDSQTDVARNCARQFCDRLPRGG